jgi:GPH family glycoside/pentoside/hexuronide:cation symporter
MTLGQSLAMILFSSLATVGTGGFGYRLTALTAMVFCLLGALVFMRFDEQRMLGVIDAGKHHEGQE